jgi:hypothetical protein
MTNLLTFETRAASVQKGLLKDGLSIGGRFVGTMKVNDVLLLHLPSVIGRLVIHDSREIHDTIMSRT